jgi:cytochrome c-type biogenesis protein CcmH
MKRRAGALALALALLAGVGGLVYVATRGPAEAGSMQDRVHSVAASLRCPVCQNLSVADSPSRLAQQMRETIATELAAGRTPSQIRAEFVSAYGEWILLAPPKSGIDLVAWAGPLLLLVGALLLAVRTLRRWTSNRSEGSHAHATGDLSPDDRRLLESALATAADDMAEDPG